MNEKEKRIKEIENTIIKKVVEEFNKTKREKLADIVTSKMEFIDEITKEERKEYTNLLISNFKFKMALITFNGVLLASMVATAGKLEYGLTVYSLLFFSLTAGILQFTGHYFRNLLDYIKGKMLCDKCKIVFKFYKSHSEDEEVYEDTKSFIRNLLFRENKTNQSSIPALTKDFDKKYNVSRAFWLAFLFEMFFYIPFILGYGLIIYKLFLYISH